MLTLAAVVEANGISEFIDNASRGMSGLHPILLLLAVAAITTFLSEFTSNTAPASLFITPLLGNVY